MAPRYRKPPAPPRPVAAPSLREQSGYSESNLPPDASYLAGMESAARQRDDALAAITQQRTSGLSDYGYGPDLTFDPNNPFSKAALLKKSYDRNRRASGQGMAAAGQQYAGAFQNQQDLINRGQLQSEDALQKSLIRFLAQNTQRGEQAQTGYTNTANQLAAERVGRFQTNPLYDPTSPAAEPAAPGFQSVPGRSKAGVPGTWHVWPNGRRVFVRS